MTIVRTAATCLLGLGLSCPALPVLAADEPPPVVALDVGGGLNMFFPFAQVKLGYRLPWLDRWEAFVGYAPFNMTDGAPVRPQTVLAGAKYWWESSGDWRPFWTGSLAYYFVPDRPAGEPSMDSPVAMVGVGVDWMLTRHIGLSGAVNLCVPPQIRPEVNLRLVL